MLAPLVRAAALATAAAQITLTIGTDQPPQHKMASPFLCFNVDTGSIYNGFDWLDPVLINLVYALNPLNSDGGVVIRIGGTAADYSYFIPEATNANGGNGHTIVGTQLLDNIVSFAGQAHATVLWDFNGLAFRNQTTFGPWDPTGNATAILDYLNSTHGGYLKWDWSIGNEPNYWPVQNKNWTQLGVDAHTLAAVLKNYKVGTGIYGPSFGGSTNTSDVAEYLKAAAGAVTGVTLHHYPVGHDCNTSAYLNSQQAVADFGRSLADVNAVRNNISKGTQLVLEEVAGSADGGCENITDRFVDGFFWLNALGTTAAAGFDRLHRQDIAGWSFTGGQSHYQLAGPAGWTNGSAALRPHPDWYTSVLFKSIVGESIINSTMSGDPSLTGSVTMHAWCNGMPWWFDMAAVVTFTNPTGADVTVSIAAVNLTLSPRTEYILTADAATYHDSRARMAAGKLLTLEEALAVPDSLNNDSVFLNGQAWQVDSNGILPALPVVGNTVTDPSQPIVLPPYSYGFLQFPTGNGTILACK